MKPGQLLPSLLIFTAAVTLCMAKTAHAQTAASAPKQAIVRVPLFTATGKGVQIYACQQSATGPQWVFQAPEADLLDAAGKSIGTHGAGPIWIANDGSSVKGEVYQKTTHDPSAIPWLSLSASAHSGTGIMTKVELIDRTETKGGIAPATGCDLQHLNATVRVPYTATYTFSSSRPWKRSDSASAVTSKR